MDNTNIHQQISDIEASLSRGQEAIAAHQLTTLMEQTPADKLFQKDIFLKFMHLTSVNRRSFSSTMNYKIQLLAQKYISTIEQERKWDDEIRLIESAITYSYIEIQNYFLQVRDKGAQARKTFYWILFILQNEQAEEILF